MLRSLTRESTEPRPSDSPDIPPVASTSQDLESLLQSDEQADARLIARAKEYTELHDNVDSSMALVDSLHSFLGTFQRDLSAISGHIADLQSRSKQIDTRLHNTKSLEGLLSPIVAQLVIPPDLIQLILDTEPSQAWLPAIQQLEAKLSAIRGGPRVPARHSLDEAADKLRIKAAEKIRLFFIDLFKPFRTSITPSLQLLQARELDTFRPLFSFLQRHAPKQAHEVQKSYVAAAAWYYETGFRRYTRALEKIRWRSSTSGAEPDGFADGAASQESGGLGAMFQRNFSTLTLVSGSTTATSAPTDAQTPAAQAVAHSSIDGPSIILAHQSDDPNFMATSEALFRSLFVILADNATTEFDFIVRFFGRPLDLPPKPSTDLSDVSSISRGWDSVSRSEESSVVADDDDDDDAATSADDSMSVITRASEHPSLATPRQSKRHDAGRADKMKRSATDHIWKQVLEPPLDYCKSFVQSILQQPHLPATSILAMARLNSAVMASLLGDVGSCPTAMMETFLMGIKLDLWPLFQREVGTQIDAVKKLTTAASSGPGLFGSSNKSAVKDSTIAAMIRKYIALFNSVVQLTTDEDEDMVFSSLMRLRGEMEKLVEAQAAKLTDARQKSLYKNSQYEELVRGLTSGTSSHPRCQKEMAHFRELARRA